VGGDVALDGDLSDSSDITLTINDSVSISGTNADLTVGGNATVTGDVSIDGTLSGLTGNLTVAGNLKVSDSLTVGDGSAVKKFLTEKADAPVVGDARFDQINKNGVSEFKISLSGAVVGDVVMLGTPKLPANTFAVAFVENDDKVTVRAFNVDTGASQDMSGTYRVTVIKH